MSKPFTKTIPFHFTFILAILVVTVTPYSSARAGKMGQKFSNMKNNASKKLKSAKNKVLYKETVGPVKEDRYSHETTVTKKNRFTGSTKTTTIIRDNEGDKFGSVIEEKKSGWAKKLIGKKEHSKVQVHGDTTHGSIKNMKKNGSVMDQGSYSEKSQKNFLTGSIKTSLKTSNSQESLEINTVKNKKGMTTGNFQKTQKGIYDSDRPKGERFYDVTTKGKINGSEISDVTSSESK